MLQVLVSLSESAYKEMCENGIDNVDYDIRQMMKNGKVVNSDRNLCDSCVTSGCVLQSGIVRKHCDFYTEEAEPCEDAVSRKDMYFKLTNGAYPNETIEQFIDRLVKELEAMPPVTPTQRWIPVSERLPEKNMRCLVAVGRFNFTEIATYSDLMEIIDHKIFYQGDVGNDSFKNITQYVKAWMPLPKAYKVVKKCCSDCKHHTNGEIHGVTPCGSCGDDKKNFEQK